ncbi:MAG: type II toxin-antitoxin system VapC family toxin [Planctomycetes bacterium]|nr:type II toxin-antitoxin system VapC family toxin [Planctomycetota bacterium]
MNVVDSSGWLEYFDNGTNANFFEPAILDFPNLIVPTISIYEVFKRVLWERNERDAKKCFYAMATGSVVELSADIALSAAKLSVQFKLPLADAIIYATSLECGATLWTQDSDFEGVPGVKYIEKQYPPKV